MPSDCTGYMCCLSACAAVWAHVHLLLSIHRCAPSSKCAAPPLEEASAGGCTFQKSGGLCLLLGLHYHTRGPARQTHCNATRGEASCADGHAGVRGLHGVRLFSILLVCVDSDGTSKQNRGEAVWPLHSHGTPAQWIRLMLAREWREEESVLVRPSSRGVDGLGLCQGLCWPEGRGDEGRSEAEGRSGPGGSPIQGSATC